jgi:hypothetical protein
MTGIRIMFNRSELEKASLMKGKRFPVPMDLSTSWECNGKWYTLRMGHERMLEDEYFKRNGDAANVMGPTHSEKLKLIEELGWEVRQIENMYHVCP